MEFNLENTMEFLLGDELQFQTVFSDRAVPSARRA